VPAELDPLLLPNFPAGHSWQLVAPGTLLHDPAEQGEQKLVTKSKNLPAPQSEHGLVPFREQLSQEIEPSLLVHVPGLHILHTTPKNEPRRRRWVLARPAGQSMQLKLEVDPNVCVVFPAEHRTQSVDPALLFQAPRMHTEQVDAPTFVLKVPAPQSRHFCLESSWEACTYCPARQMGPSAACP